MKSKFVKTFGISKRALAAAYRQAANLIAEHGWVQGRFGNQEVGYCALGALYKVGHDGGERIATTPLKKLSGLGYNLPNWNDQSGTTKQDVIRAFRKAAAKLEHGAEVSA